MLVNCENWRLEKKVDELYEKFIYEEDDKVSEIYPRFYHKTDKYGRPIYIEVLGKLDLEQLFKVTTKERLEQNFIFEYEKLIRKRLEFESYGLTCNYSRLPACSEKAGYHIETSCTILDLKNCSVMQALKIRDLLKLVVDIGQNYYPETMGKTFIINAPWLFDTIWNILKNWLDEVTVNKIRIYKAGKDFSAQMFEFIDPQNLPFSLGGACQCEGVGCERSDAGPWNPSSKS